MPVSPYVIPSWLHPLHVHVLLIDLLLRQAVSYVELQNVQLRTIDGKEVAQLRFEGTLESMSALGPDSNSALFAGAVPADLGSAGGSDEKVFIEV